MNQEAPKFKRWYDHDPLLLKVINLLRDYQDDLREQAQIFLDSVEEKVSKEAIDKFYELVKPMNGGTRWYDNDPVISKTVELLRVVPQSVQKTVSQMFIETLKSNGIKVDD
ncbi:MAG: hypothetical protein IJ877_03625 [Candidatus Gastranaerophilales bacterium]|nr:hypothetical protein [Candidatus Gastranaerophilales bacterium]